jgi:hypothetical protein
VFSHEVGQGSKVVLEVQIVENFSLVNLGFILVVPVEPDWVPILIHGVHVLPCVRVLEESVVVAITVRTWLIAVDLSLPEEISVVIAGLACLHLLSHTFSTLDWVRESQNCSILTFLVVGSES